MSGPWIIAFVALWVLVLVLGVIVLGLLRQTTPLLSHTEQLLQGVNFSSLGGGGLKPGEEVPPFELYDLEGRSLSIDEALPLPAIFLFVDSGCEPCRKLTSELSDYAHHFDVVHLYVVPGEGNVMDDYESLRNQGVLVYGQRDSQASQAFRQKAFPQAFAVR